MNFHGLVTDIDYNYGKFTIDNQYHIYAGYLIAFNNSKLPILSQNVTVTNCVKYKRNKIFLNLNSKIISNEYCSDYNQKKCQIFVNIVRKLVLLPADIIQVIKLIDKLEEFNVFPFNFLQNTAKNINISSSTLIFNSLYFLINKELNYTFDNELLLDDLLDPKLEQLSIKIPSNYKIKINDKPLEGMASTLWNFGVMKSEANQFLIGFLHISKKIGFMILSDINYYIVCVIPNNNTTDFSCKISKLLNNFVVIKKYRIFTENYKNFGLIQYLYIDINDISIIETNCTYKQINIIYNFLLNEYKLTINVINRTSVALKKKKIHCFIHCKFKNNSNELKEVLLRLNEDQLYLYPIFNRNDVYLITTNEKSFIKQLNHLETIFISFTINNKRTAVIDIPENVQVQFIENKFNYFGETSNKYKVLSVKEIDTVLKENDPDDKGLLYHFEGIVVKKILKDPFSSIQTTSVTHKAFGTPGPKIHQIILKNVQDLTTEFKTLYFYGDEPNFDEIFRRYLEEDFPGLKDVPLHAYVYMHNFENLQCPLGLIPGMKVRVNYILPQKSKYFKPTFLTSIEIMSYEPVYDFETCYECLDICDWGPQCPLGAGYNIPTDCVCWNPVETIKINYLSIHFTCSKCNKRIAQYQKDCCEDNDFTMQFILILLVRDSGGICDVIVKDNEILRILLERREIEWSIWRKLMRIAREFTTSVDDDYPARTDDPIELFKTSFLHTIEVYNKVGIHYFDLKCRKLDKNKSDHNDNPKWFCVEARINYVEKFKFL